MFKKSNLLVIYYLAFAACVFSYGVYKPMLNWDMVGYAASAKHLEIKDPVELHQFIYSELSETVSAPQYKRLTEFNQRREDITKDPLLFNQQLPFFEIRPIYTLSVLATSKLGVNIFRATYVVSSLCVFAGIILLFFSLRKSIKPILLVSLPPLLVGLGLLTLAQLSTPDGLTFLFICLFIGLYLAKKIPHLLFLLPLFVLVRTDLIIFNFLVLLCFFVFFNKHRITCLLSGVTTVLLYLTINHVYGNYGWSVLVYISFMERSSAPADVNAVIGITDYLQILFNGLVKSLKDAPFFINLALFISNLSLIKIDQKARFKNLDFWVLVAIPAIYIAAHFLLFPATWKRFFVGFYAMNFIYLLLWLSNHSCQTVKSPKSNG